MLRERKAKMGLRNRKVRVYELANDVVNPTSDKRKKYEAGAVPLFPKGTRFLLRTWEENLINGDKWTAMGEIIIDFIVGHPRALTRNSIPRYHEAYPLLLESAREVEGTLREKLEVHDLRAIQVLDFIEKRQLLIMGDAFLEDVDHWVSSQGVDDILVPEPETSNASA